MKWAHVVVTAFPSISQIKILLLGQKSCCIRLSRFEFMHHECKDRVTSFFNVTLCALLLHTVPDIT